MKARLTCGCSAAATLLVAPHARPPRWPACWLLWPARFCMAEVWGSQGQSAWVRLSWLRLILWKCSKCRLEQCMQSLITAAAQNWVLQRVLLQHRQLVFCQQAAVGQLFLT